MRLISTPRRLSRLADRTLRVVVCTALLLAAATVSSIARADLTGVRLSLDWSKVAREMQRASVPFLSRRESPRRRDAQGRPDASGAEPRAVVSPHLTLVARDWGEAYHLAGGALGLTDEFRLSRSSRMVVTRARLDAATFAPFVHVGLGQWRVDTDLMPVYVRNTELATQLGGGFDLQMARRWALALEVDYTILVRDEREAQSFPTPHLWGAFLVSRASF